MRQGNVPYRDFYLEYPPGAVPVFLAPTVAGASYPQAFRALTTGLGALGLGVVLLTLRLRGLGTHRLLAAAVLGGLAPIALGPVYVMNFDVWPALLTAGALAALVAPRERLGFALLGLAVAAKFYAAVLLPVAAVLAWRRHGLRAVAFGVAAFAAAMAAVVLPFVALAPGAVGFSLYVQLKRPLQIESLGASFLLAAHQLGLYGGSVNSDYNSQNLDGSLAAGIAVATSVLSAAALAFVWLRYARGRLGFLTASAAAVTAFVAFGKVLSPQYLIWLVPLVLLLERVLPVATLAAALVLTHLWFPGRYGRVVGFHTVEWLVFVRDLTLVALLVVLVRQGRTRERAEAGPPVAPALQPTRG